MVAVVAEDNVPVLIVKGHAVTLVNVSLKYVRSPPHAMHLQPGMARIGLDTIDALKHRGRKLWLLPLETLLEVGRENNRHRVSRCSGRATT